MKVDAVCRSSSNGVTDTPDNGYQFLSVNKKSDSTTGPTVTLQVSVECHNGAIQRQTPSFGEEETDKVVMEVFIFDNTRIYHSTTRKHRRTQHTQNDQEHRAVVHQRASNISQKTFTVTVSSFCSAHMVLHHKEFVVRVEP